jgi:predicted RNA binding protein YcfA (HicA-like mRNA interferase family)
MSKSGVFKPYEIIRALEKNGYVRVGQKGSHIKFRKGSIVIVVPNHAGKDISYGLGLAILKKAGVDIE